MKNLKQFYLTIIAIFLFTFAGSANLNAQHAEFGLRFLPTFSKFDMNTSDGNTVKGEVSLGYGFGAFVGYNFNPHIGIQAEIMYTSISQKYKEENVERRVNLRYLNVPLLLSLNTGKTRTVNLNAVAGPQIGFNVGADVSSSGDGDGTASSSAVISVKKGDLGFAYGAGVDFGLNADKTFRLGVGFRGVYGFLDISDTSKSDSNDSFYILDKSNVQTYSGYIGVSILFGSRDL